MKFSTGYIIVMAYPDTFVKMSDEWICKFLPYLGLGTKEYIKAGHAAQVLIDGATGEAFYYDFGRYVTPKGMGRVRSAHTDAELEIPFKAAFDSNGKLINFHDFIIWLEANPQKTHGKGRLLASLCESIDFKKAKSFADRLQAKGSIPYGAFDKNGSNCSRFVTDTLLESTLEKKIKKALSLHKLFTPSTIGNVEKAAALKQIFQVYQGKIEIYKGSALKENLTNYFDRKISIKQDAQRQIILRETLYKLDGIGSSAYFELHRSSLPAQHFRIKRYNDLGEMDYDGVYHSTQFDDQFPFEFTYDSHCAFCHVLQNGKKIILERLTSYEAFNSWQKGRSA
jgi:Family of unknown function (DUF6695)